MVDGLFGFEVWRQHREDLLREAEQARLARTAGGGRRFISPKSLLRSLSGMFAGQSRVEEGYGFVPKPGVGGDVRKIPGRDRRCKSKAA